MARAKDQIKRFRRRSGSSVSTPGRVQVLLSKIDPPSQIISQDLPPPYSENPPMNPFYSERHDLSGPDLDHSGLDDSRPLVVSPPSQPAATHDPLYQHQQVCRRFKIDKLLIWHFCSTSSLFYIQLPHLTRHQTRHLLSLSSPSNLTPTPSLAADRK